MAWLQLSWKLDILDKNEKSDEPSLQFIFVTIFDGVVRIHPHKTGNLFKGGGFGTGSIGWPGNRPFGIFNSRNVPTVRNPFLGLVVRAVELDNSGDSDREKDYQNLQDAVQRAVEDTLRAGGVPDSTILWRAANGVRLIDNFGDDDDRIGVSARAFPNYGREIAAAIEAEPRLRSGGTIMADTIRPIELGFIEADAHYKLIDSEIRIVTNTPQPTQP